MKRLRWTNQICFLVYSLSLKSQLSLSWERRVLSWHRWLRRTRRLWRMRLWIPKRKNYSLFRSLSSWAGLQRRGRSLRCIWDTFVCYDDAIDHRFDSIGCCFYALFPLFRHDSGRSEHGGGGHQHRYEGSHLVWCHQSCCQRPLLYWETSSRMVCR